MKKLKRMNRTVIVGAALLVTAGASKSMAQNAFASGELLVSASTYQGNSGTIVVGSTVLPASSPTTTAVANGSYPNFTNNDSADANFGITSPLSLIEINPTTGTEDMTYNVTANTGMVTSFTSKSEGSLSLSQNGTAVTIMGYDSTINQLDISNSNTPGDPNGTNGATTLAPNTYRAISQINADGSSSLTDVNTYSGDNPRAAILASNGDYYTVGNSGDKTTNGNGLTSVGAQIVTPGGNPTSNSTSLGSFNTTQVGNPADTQSKDNNFRGETIYNNTVYATKGSGSNGIDTVYQVGATGTLPTGTGNAINVLPGFNTLSAKNDGKNTAASDFTHPFGLFFANSTTLYVGDEGSGKFSDIALAAQGKESNGQEFAGLDKYSLVSGTWKLDYVLSLGLNLGQSYTVSGTTPGGDTGSYTVESTGGLRDITGKVNADGTVSIYGITSTLSTNADQGADPNKLVSITDALADTTSVQSALESFNTLETANYGQVLRGVAFTPQAVPEPSSWALGGICLGIFAWLHKRARRTLS